MIYCLTSLDSEGKTLYKIGYTDDIETRITHYKVHNPSIKLVKVKEGSKLDERCIHTCLHLKGFCKYRQEWYEYNDTIKEIFNQSIDEVNQYLWENKKTVFSKTKLKSLSWYNLYKKLERRNKNKNKRY